MLSSDGVKLTTGWPLNQKSAPAASFSAVVWPLGLSSGVGLAPLPTNSTVWKPGGTNFTLSPTCTETELGKKALASEPYWRSNVFVVDAGSPMSTVFVAAEATAGTARLARAATKAALVLWCTLTPK